MKLKKLASLFISTSLIICFGACQGKSQQANNATHHSESENAMKQETSGQQVGKDPISEKHGSKQIIVYFPNWNLDTKPADSGGEVGSIAWDAVTMINHAFFAPFPDDGTTDSSWERKAQNLEARTRFKLVSTLSQADFEDNTKSAFNNLPRNHFTQYAEYSKKYPDVKIMISVGGWSRSGFFSEMVYTPEGRSSFISSCVSLMKEYPFINGIDIDWEYPAGSMDGQRYPESDSDEGCPIWSSPSEDNSNFTLLLSEMRNTFDKEFGEERKLITACASSSTGWTLPCQDWPAWEPYLDYINIMTYDLAGKWAGVTGHQTPENLTKSAMAYFFNKKMNKTKLNLGSPMYPLWLKMSGNEIPAYVINAPIDVNATMTAPISDTLHTQQFERESVTGYTYTVVDNTCIKGESFDKSEGNTKKGWNAAFDDKAGAAYLYNNDPESPYYMWFATYENPLSLQRKIDLIYRFDLAGIIVWESSQDTPDHLMLNRMKDALK